MLNLLLFGRHGDVVPDAISTQQPLRNVSGLSSRDLVLVFVSSAAR